MMPSMKRRQLFSLTLAATLTGAAAQEAQARAVKVDQAWARPTVPGQSAGGAYLTLRNTGATPDRLLGGSTPAAARVEVHEMRMDGDVMRMRELQALDVPVGRSVKLEPGGLHLMLIGLRAPLGVGDKIPLQLHLDKAGTIDVVLDVQLKPIAPAGAHKH